MAEREKLIELKDLQITFGSGKKKFVAVDHVNFDIYKGETFSLVASPAPARPPLAVPSAASTDFRRRYLLQGPEDQRQDLQGTGQGGHP